MADFAFTLNNFFFTIQQYLDNIENNYQRCGAIEFLAILVGRLEPQMLIAAASLLAPLALKTIADPLQSIRELSAIAFGKVVALLHLESVRI